MRKQSFGVGVERTFPLHSPKIERIEVAARGDVRRAKLYYLRGRVGKRARVRERRYAARRRSSRPGLLHDQPPSPSRRPPRPTALPTPRAVAGGGARGPSRTAARARARPSRAEPRRPSPGLRGRRLAGEPREVRPWAGGEERGSQPAATLLELVLIVAGRSGWRSPSRRSSSSPTGSQRVDGADARRRPARAREPGELPFPDPERATSSSSILPRAEPSNTVRWPAPAHGQACRAPAEQRDDVNFIKRVVAVPGDTIAIEHGHAVVNGKVQKETFIRPCGGGEGCNFPRGRSGSAGHYFMMGDNRGSPTTAASGDPSRKNGSSAGPSSPTGPPIASASSEARPTRQC